jgi:hypothetical protein
MTGALITDDVAALLQIRHLPLMQAMLSNQAPH